MTFTLPSPSSDLKVPIISWLQRIDSYTFTISSSVGAWALTSVPIFYINTRSTVQTGVRMAMGLCCKNKKVFAPITKYLCYIENYYCSIR